MNRIFIALCCTLAITAVACSGGSPSSPSSVGATIAGTVVSTPAAGGAAGANSQALVVSVSGTKLSTSVDPSGAFRLGGVPPGDVQLTFNSQGATSTVAVANVADKDLIELEVTITGGTAKVVTEARNGDKERRVVHIKKFTNGRDADEAPGPTIDVGAAVTWTYIVTNESPLPFARMSVTDSRGVEVSCPRELPAPGASVTCTGSGIAEAGPYRNVGTVTVMVNNREHTSSNPSHYFGGPVRGVTLRKFTNGQHVSEAPGPVIPVGSPVVWTYVVTNTSASTFSSLSVTDDRGVTVACPSIFPAPGASITCTGSGTAEAGQYRNVGTVIATGSGQVFTDRDESFYFGGPARGVTIRKFTNGQHVSEAPGPQIPVGSPVVWTYVVTNTSLSTFSSLSVTDDRGVTVACPSIFPAPGASITCTGSGTAEVGQYRNVGTVIATGSGQVFTDRDQSFYFGGAKEEPKKVELCHRTGNGKFHMIEVSVDAEPAHRKHGDGKVGEPVPGSPGRVFTASCGIR